MGFSETNISFMIIDDTPIEVESASSTMYFKFKTIRKLAEGTKYDGNFSETTKGSYYYRLRNGDFVEFKIKLSPDMSEYYFKKITGDKLKRIADANDLELELKW